jgi:hypothetical protein
MSVGKTHRLYLIGSTPENAVKNVPYHDVGSAQEDAIEDENIYSIDVTLFASRLKPVKKWD